VDDGALAVVICARVRRPLETCFRLLLVTCSVLAGAAAFAQAPRVPRAVPAAERLFSGELPPTLDGRLGLAYRLGRGQTGPADGLHPILGDSVDGQGLRVTLLFAADLDEATVERIGAHGCAVARLPDGSVASVGPVVEARCPWEALEPLAGLRGLVQVAPTFGYWPVPPQAAPVNRVATEVEAVALREKARPQGRGQGVVVADIDSGFDPFHPFFFRADGGAYDWIDVDANGFFEPGLDAVDFNRNGVADPGEKLGMIKAVLYSFYTMPNLYNATSPFVAGLDWLFQDENSDGVRNQGTVPPYGDGKPTFGEQLYVADDVNGNGQLDVGERVIRLHTPKVKAAMSWEQGAAKIYRRGVDLSKYPSLYPRHEMHGTMVMGTVAGGDPRYMRYAGIAPDAELVFATSGVSSLVSALSFVRNEGAQIVLWEMATWYMEYLDGSAAVETACDAASDQGVLQIGAAGNLGGSDKHRVKVHGPGTETVPLVIPSPQASYVIGNFNWRGGASSALSFSVSLNGTTVALSGSNGSTWAGNTQLYWSRQTSPRGTHMLIFYLLAPQGQAVPAQTVQFTVTNSGGSVPLHGYVMDSNSSWEKFVHWPLPTGATNAGTYGTPGVGDKTMAIGTMYIDFVPSGQTAGALAKHSGEGPRIDGLDTVDLVVPEDHVTALSWQAQAPFGALMVGGGTSNSSPVLLGMAALLKELRPGASPAQLRDLLRQNAHVEAQMGAVPNDRWGYGKGRVYRAHHAGALPPTSSPPVAVGTARRTGVTVTLDASGSSDPEGGALRYYWDADYDGSWDLGPLDAPVAVWDLTDPEQRYVKLEVVDPHGRSGAALIPVVEMTVSQDGGMADAGVDPDAGTAVDGGGGGGSGPKQVRYTWRGDDLGKEAGGGCGCSGARGPGAGWLVPLFLAGAAFVRRRRVRVGGGS
jgi:MYXO-CTERM domain-containing protein